MDKNIKKKRMMTYFIDATDEIIKNEGIEYVTIRKVASNAGYNSATIYNYFKNLDHLILFSSLKYLNDYTAALPKYLMNAHNSAERFLKVWECFCYFSFKNPEIYHSIFFARLNDDHKEVVKEYYNLFPDDLGIHSEDATTEMLLKYNIYERDMILVSECVKEGLIRAEDMESMNEMATMIYEGILLKVLNGKIDPEYALEKTMKYIVHITDSFLIK
ncbi:MULTISPECIES: TetR/AcrR family transcriptional regulator [unclassified Sedimentibacter]|uniref:TetR/AcrR family transcriptional regulator n=1 Tax=unclassified Sedimentibacter TaxID=2649220 RepID=UPI0027DF2BA5|nr:TetR/AcrR family transcriptional regulator [Sedimentibacter sp. MB35-C1]WMJ76831.1 TetR/AcrR family transcriptional regulator [Sedimentibacter sp. MB35-C1]